MSRGGVVVEIKKAGDGVNYPKKGKQVVIHYSGTSCFREHCVVPTGMVVSAHEV